MLSLVWVCAYFKVNDIDVNGHIPNRGPSLPSFSMTWLANKVRCQWSCSLWSHFGLGLAVGTFWFGFGPSICASSYFLVDCVVCGVEEGKAGGERSQVPCGRRIHAPQQESPCCLHLRKVPCGVSVLHTELAGPERDKWSSGWDSLCHHRIIISQRPWAKGAGMSHPNWTGLFVFIS